MAVANLSWLLTGLGIAGWLPAMESALAGCMAAIALTTWELARLPTLWHGDEGMLMIAVAFAAVGAALALVSCLLALRRRKS